MHIEPFQMERWQSEHEHHVDINLSDSGVHPLLVSELITDPEERARLLDRPLEYIQTNGTIPLRERISALYEGATVDDILVTSGGIEANFLSVWNLIGPGDEVILLNPNYQQIEGLTPAFGGRLIRWNMRPDWESGRWMADLDELRDLVTDRTRVIAICNPNNPTGATFDAAWLDELGSIAGNAWVLADEIYTGSELVGPPTPSMWGRHERVIVTNSLSKAYGLPGLRLGWIATNADKAAELWKHHDYTTIAPSALSDTLATAALEPERRRWLLGRTRERLRANLDLVCSWLDEHRDTMRYIRPAAGAMLWLEYRHPIGSTELASRLRHEAGVLLVPGDQYGMDGWLRIGFGGESDHVREGVARLNAFLSKLGSGRAPGYDIAAFRELGHAVVDRLAEYLEHTGDVVKWREPAEMRERWPNAFPAKPAEPLPLVERLLQDSIHQHHPRYIGHQVAPVMPNAAIFDLIASLLNNGSSSYDAGPATATMEQSCIGWMLDHLGWKNGGGVLTSGGSLGNLTALLAARQASEGDAWRDGAGDAAFLVSGAAHYSLHRAIRIMGLGDAGIVAVDVDGEGRMSVEALAVASEASDRRILGVIANAGATVTGCVDPLSEIADWCEERSLWLHVDGAHGASALVSERYRGVLAGIERADSVVWDAHKLLALPALITGVLFRENKASYATFAQDAAYIFLDGQEPERWYDTGLRTLECTKRMVGATLYLTLATTGTDALAANIETVFERTRELAALLSGLPDFEILAEPTLNILCYRHLAGVGDVDAHQLAVREALLRGGSFYLTRTTFQGKTWLRSTVVNPATQTSDLLALVEAIRDVSARVTDTDSRPDD